MNIEITGRHVHITESVSTYAREKAEKVAKFLKKEVRVEVLLDHERDHFTVEMIVSGYRGPVIVGHVTHTDAKAAIDLAIDKVEHQLRKLRGRAKDHHGPSMAGDLLDHPDALDRGPEGGPKP